jgi:hypothetical protein
MRGVQTDRSLGYYGALVLVMMPIFIVFIIPLPLYTPAELSSAGFFLGLVLLSLLGCGIGGGYEPGCIWHYHGTPECVTRPDIDELVQD